MGFMHEREKVQGMILALKPILQSLSHYSEEASTHLQDMVDTDAIQGKTADKIKEYLKTTDGYVAGPFQAACISLYGIADRYLADWVRIDGISDAKLWETELDKLIGTNMQQDKGFSLKTAEIQKAIEEAYKRAATEAGKSTDCNVDPSGVYSAINKVYKETDDLITKIKELEKKYTTDGCELTKLQTELVKLGAFIVAEAQRRANGETSYKSLTNTNEFKELSESYSALVTEINNNAKETAEAQEVTAEYTEKLIREYEERQKKAQRVKFLVGALCVVGAVAFTAITGGAGGVIAGAAVGAITGGVNAAASSWAEQYVGSVGCKGTFDMGKFALDVGKGALIGGVSGAIGGGFGKVNVTSTGIKKVLIKGALKGAEKAVTGIATRTIDSAFEGKNIIKGFVEATISIDTVGDLGKGFITGAIGEGIKMGQDKIIGSHDISIDNSTGTNLLVGGTNIVGDVAVKGPIGRLVGTSISTGSIKQGWEDATDEDKIKADFIDSTIENATSFGFVERDKKIIDSPVNGKTTLGEKALDRRGEKQYEKEWKSYQKEHPYARADSTKERVRQQSYEHVIDAAYATAGKTASNAGKGATSTIGQLENKEAENIDNARNGEKGIGGEDTENEVTKYKTDLTSNGIEIDEAATRQATDAYRQEKASRAGIAQSVGHDIAANIDKAKSFFGAAIPDPI